MGKQINEKPIVSAGPGSWTPFEGEYDDFDENHPDAVFGRPW